MQKITRRFTPLLLMKEITWQPQGDFSLKKDVVIAYWLPSNFLLKKDAKIA
jgi:hypothetical protein